MPRSTDSLWTNLARLGHRVAHAEDQIRDLFEMSVDDHKAMELQREATDLLRKLGENHSRRLTLVEQTTRQLKRIVRSRKRQ